MREYAIYHIVVFDISLHYIHMGYLQKYVTQYFHKCKTTYAWFLIFYSIYFGEFNAS